MGGGGRKAEAELGTNMETGLCRPDGAWLPERRIPWLTPWATFFRRSAAGNTDSTRIRRSDRPVEPAKTRLSLRKWLISRL